MRPSGRPFATPSRDLLAGYALLLCGLVGEAAITEPGRREGRAGRHRIAEDPVLCVEVRNKAGEREDGGLANRVVGHAGRRPLAGCRAHVHDPPAPPFAHSRHNGADRADVAHDIQLPGRLPVFLRQVPT